MKYVKTILLSLIIVFSFSLIVASMNNSLKWWRNKTIIKKLSLSNEQSDSIEEIFLEAEKKKIDLLGEIKKIKLELEQKLEMEDISGQQVDILVDKLAKAHAGLLKHNLTTRISIMRTLDYVQRQKIRQIKQFFNRRTLFFKNMRGDFFKRYKKLFDKEFYKEIDDSK